MADWTPEPSEGEHTLPTSGQPWHDEAWQEKQAQVDSGYGDSLAVNYMHLPLAYHPDRGVFVGMPGQSHLTEEVDDWNNQDAGIDQLPYEQRGQYQGAVNVLGNQYSVHWPDHPMPDEAKAEAHQKIHRMADTMRQNAWEEWQENGGEDYYQQEMAEQAKARERQVIRQWREKAKARRLQWEAANPDERQHAWYSSDDMKEWDQANPMPPDPDYPRTSANLEDFDFTKTRPPDLESVKFVHDPETGETHAWKASEVGPEGYITSHDDVLEHLGLNWESPGAAMGIAFPSYGAEGKPDMLVSDYRRDAPLPEEAKPQVVERLKEINPAWAAAHHTAANGFDYDDAFGNKSLSGAWKYMHHIPTGQTELWPLQGMSNISQRPNMTFSGPHHFEKAREFGWPEPQNREHEGGRNDYADFIVGDAWADKRGDLRHKTYKIADSYGDVDKQRALHDQMAEHFRGLGYNVLPPGAYYSHVSAYQDEQGNWQYDDEIEPPPTGEWTPARERYPQWTQKKAPPTRSTPPGPPPGTFTWLDREKPGEIHGLGGDCVNPKCDHSWTPQEQHQLAQYGEVTCPACGKLQNNIGQLGKAPSDEEYMKAQLHRNPVRAGITLDAMGRIGEAVVSRIQLPCGPVERDLNAELGRNAPLDFVAGYPGKEWGVEVKANHSEAQPRFKLSGSSRKRQKMIEFCHVHGFRQGFVGVRLNFYTDKADVFFREGFTDTWYGDTQMQHLGTFNFGDLNPFRQSDGSHHVPPVESMPDQAAEGEDMQRVASGPGLPPEPGSTPIPPNHVRLYHYTGAPEGTIDQEGLRIERAKGDTYGEPNRVWASAEKPSDQHRYVEFSMAHDDPRWDIGKYQEGINYGYPEQGYGPEAWAQRMQQVGSNVTFHGDIRPEEFIAVHEPWHQHLRYLIENHIPLEDVAWLEESAAAHPSESRAVTEYRKYLAEHQSRVASGEVMYHVAPTKARRSILKHGLDPERAKQPVWMDRGYYPPGTYMHKNLEDAVGHADSEYNRPEGEKDIWEVRPSGLRDDPLSSAFGGGSSYAGRPIPPEQIRLMHPDEWYEHEDEWTASVRGHLAKSGADHDGAMVALFVPGDTAKELAVEGGEPAKDLHITLAFFAAKAADEPDEYWAGVKDVIEQVAREHAPLKVTIGGLGRFNGGDDDDFQPLIGTVDCVGLVELHMAIKDKLGDEYPLNEEHGFNPHLTLQYIDRDADDPNLQLPVEFEVDSLTLMVGGERSDFDLTGESHTSAAPGRMYHLSPRSDRDSILANGLDWQRASRPLSGDFERANYLFRDDPSHWASTTPGFEDDVWEVNHEGLPLEPDPDHPDGAAMMVRQPIPPDRLRLISRTDTYESSAARTARLAPARVLSPAEYRDAAAGRTAAWRDEHEYHRVTIPQAHHHCGSCGAFNKGHCSMFDATVDNDYTCNEWVSQSDWEKEQDDKAADKAISHEAASEMTEQAMLRRVRPFMKKWVDGPHMGLGLNFDLFERHAPILDRYKPTQPVRVYRTENPNEGPAQYNRHTSWTTDPWAAKGFGYGNRGMVTMMAHPDQIAASIPHLDRAARKYGWKPFDFLGQSEIVMKPGEYAPEPYDERHAKTADKAISHEASLQTKDYEGEPGNTSHITRVQTGTVPTSALANMIGAKGEQPGEHRNKQGEQWEQFKADVAANGIREPIFITVDPGQEPKINEGNHRRDAAVEVGLPEVPIEIRYYGHAERGSTTLSKMAMAEQSGDPQLDELIQEFMRQGVYDMDAKPDATDTTWVGLPLEELRNPAQSWSKCDLLAKQFASFLEGHGMDAEAVENHHHAWGYDDVKPPPGGGMFRDHYVTEVMADSGAFIVDWTASQYGYTEFPMVSRLSEQGEYKRQWAAKIASDDFDFEDAFGVKTKPQVYKWMADPEGKLTHWPTVPEDEGRSPDDRWYGIWSGPHHTEKLLQVYPNMMDEEGVDPRFNDPTWSFGQALHFPDSNTYRIDSAAGADIDPSHRKLVAQRMEQLHPGAMDVGGHYQPTTGREPPRPRFAMADRSGIPEVDALIEAFLKETIAGQEDGWNPGFSPPTIDSLRDPENSHGYCQEISEQFAAFAKQHGFQAYVTHTDVDEMGYTPTGPGGEIGFDENDEMQYGHYPEHTIVTLSLKDPNYAYGREVYVDFTASQYGYTDHPKVTTSKTAAMYHVAPRSARDSIQAAGLTLPEAGTQAVWAFPQLEDAQSMMGSSFGGSRGDNDLWEINGGEWEPDSHAGWNEISGENGRSMMSRQPIPPQSMRLVTAKTAAGNDQYDIVEHARSMGVHLDPGAEDALEYAGFQAPHFRFSEDTISVPEYMKGMSKFETPEQWFGDGEEADYVRQMAREPGQLPPGLVNADTNELMDGAHRLIAHHMAGQPTMPVLKVHHTGPNAYTSRTADWHEDEHPRNPKGEFTVKEGQHKVAAYDRGGKLLGHWERCRHCGTVFARPAHHKGRLHCPTCGEDVDRRLRRVQHVAVPQTTRLLDDLARRMGWEFAGYQQSSNHRTYDWTEPGTGIVHRVIGAGNHGGGGSVPEYDVNHMRQRMTKCMNGACQHGFGGKAALPPEIELQDEPGAFVLKPGTQVSYGGKHWWIMDVDGGLAHIYDAKGQEDIVPTQQLRAAKLRHIAMGMNGDLPPINFQWQEDETHGMGMGKSKWYLHAMHPETGQNMGHVTVTTNPEKGDRWAKIRGLDVEPEWRRRGIASALVNHMAERYPQFEHDDEFTDDGKDFHQGYEGYYPSDDWRYENEDDWREGRVTSAAEWQESRT